MTRLELVIGVILWVTIAFCMGLSMRCDKRCECDDCPYRDKCKQGGENNDTDDM